METRIATWNTLDKRYNQKGKCMKQDEGHVKHERTDQSAVAKQVKEKKAHRIDWDNTKIIANESHTLKRKVKESLAIHRKGRKKLMNVDCGLQLSDTWLDLVAPAKVKRR